MKKALLIGVVAVLFAQMSFSQKNAKPIISSNNFSAHDELWESIGNGILNFQADVMYIYGNIYVTPLMPDSANHKLPTLTGAYLYPLYNQFKKNNGEIIPGYSGDVFLILNFSAQPIQLYKQLAIEMRPFSDMLTYSTEGKMHQGKLRILIKDEVQFEKINGIKPSFLGLVGHMIDIGKNIDSNKMPLIEVDFDEITSWKGIGNIPFEDFMNCPSNETAAELIKTSKADFINTSEALRMAEFFEESE